MNIVTFVDCNFVQWQCLFYSPQKLFHCTIDIPCYHFHQSHKPTGTSQLPLQDSMSCRYHQHFLVHLRENVRCFSNARGSTTKKAFYQRHTISILHAQFLAAMKLCSLSQNLYCIIVNNGWYDEESE